MKLPAPLLHLNHDPLLRRIGSFQSHILNSSLHLFIHRILLQKQGTNRLNHRSSPVQNQQVIARNLIDFLKHVPPFHHLSKTRIDIRMGIVGLPSRTVNDGVIEFVDVKFRSARTAGESHRPLLVGVFGMIFLEDDLVQFSILELKVFHGGGDVPDVVDVGGGHAEVVNVVHVVMEMDAVPEFVVDLGEEEGDGVWHEREGGEFDNERFGDAGPGGYVLVGCVLWVF
mmetsp:Transcript_18141/g.37855  ORF Transcript_18141/g.37855 Transcript_18141/m.37855 type:complete len:227 (+) Transcript_18141:258-938(+)